MSNELKTAEDNIYQFSRTWGMARARDMRRAFRASFKKQTGKGATTIRSRVRKKYGETDRISFNSKRYAFILAAGSDSYQLANGATHPGIKGKDWITPSIAPYQGQLADYVAAQDADAVVKTLKFKQNQ